MIAPLRLASMQPPLTSPGHALDEGRAAFAAQTWGKGRLLPMLVHAVVCGEPA